MPPRKPPQPLDPAVLADLDSPDYTIRSAAVRALAKTRNPDAVPLLIPRLKDKTIAVRRLTIRALGKIHDARAIAPIIEQLGHSACHVHRPAYEEIQKFGAPAIPDLIAALTHKQKYVRGNSVSCLGILGAQEAIPALVERLQDGEAFVIFQATNALSRLGGPQACDALWALWNRAEDTLPHGDHFAPYSLRRFALQSLTDLGDTRVLDPLLDMLACGDSTGPRLIRRFLEVTSGDAPGRAAALAAISHGAAQEEARDVARQSEPS